MTNVSSFSVTTQPSATTGGTFTYQTPNNSGTLENCVQFTTTTDGNITVSAVSGSHGNVCTGIINSSTFQHDINGTKAFGGSKVSY